MGALFGCGYGHARMWDGNRYGGYNFGCGCDRGMSQYRRTPVFQGDLPQFNLACLFQPGMITWSRWPLVIEVNAQTLMSWEIKAVAKSAYCRPIGPTHPQVTKTKGRHVLKSLEVAANPKVLEPCLQTPIYLPGTVLYVVSLCKQVSF